jgi:Zn-finger nucleic acid-binding protein
MPYRNQKMQCPRCGKELVPYPDRDKWRCTACYGALVGGDQLEVEIGPHAREVVSGPADPARPALHPCPICAFPMTPYTIEKIELDRCVEHALVWFDGGEIGKVRARIPAADDSPLFTNALRFVAELRAEQAALAAGALDEIPREEPQAPMTSGQWQARELCGDGSCTGVIGDDGKCGACGRLRG